MELQVHKISASRLSTLLQVLGALIVDYLENPNGKMRADLIPLTKFVQDWRDVPHLREAVAAATSGRGKMEALYTLGQDLRQAFPKFRAVSEFTTPELKMLKACASYLLTDSETALRLIKANARIFGAPALAQALLPDVPAADHSGLRKVVKKIAGRDGVHLSMQEVKLLQETDPEAYARYAELRKGHNQQFKSLLSQFVRESGKTRLPYPMVYKHFWDQGFTHSMVPGFTGQIDDQGRWYDSQGKLIGGVPNLITYDRVVMNDGSDPDASWTFKAIKHDGGAAYGYTSEFRQQQSHLKYSHVADLMKKLPTIRAKWLKKVKAFDVEDPVCVASVVLEILYSFAARIGSQPGRGAGTILVKNVSETSQGYNIAYIGKDSIPTKHVIKRLANQESAAVCDALAQLLDGKKPSELMFTVVKGQRRVAVPPSYVNKVFRAFGCPPELSVHKLRTCRGTNLFRQLVEKDAAKRPPMTEKEAIARWKEMTEQIGKLLNHKRGVGTATEKVTGTTAAGSYIDTAAQLALFQRWGFRAPLILEKMLANEDAK